MEALRADFERLETEGGEGASGDATKALIAKMATEKVIGAKILARNAALNKVARVQMVDYALTTWADTPGLAMEALLVGVTRGARQGSRASVINTQAVTFNKHVMGMIYDMGEDWKLFVSGALDADILKAAHQLDAETPNFNGIDPAARKMAEVVKKHSESLRLLANQHGANIGKLDGWLSKHTHDHARINKNQDAWRKAIAEEVDWARSFPDVDRNDADAVAEVIDGLWLSMSTGIHSAAPGAGRFGAGMQSVTAPESRFTGEVRQATEAGDEAVLAARQWYGSCPRQPHACGCFDGYSLNPADVEAGRGGAVGHL